MLRSKPYWAFYRPVHICRYMALEGICIHKAYKVDAAIGSFYIRITKLPKKSSSNTALR